MTNLLPHGMPAGQSQATPPGPAPLVDRADVVVTCHNYGRFLEACVNSALASTYPVCVTIVDDASTDNSWAVAERLARAAWEASDTAPGGKQCRVWAVRNSVNLGAAISRNRGAEMPQGPKGKYMCFLDADDKIGPDYLAEAVEALEAGADVVYPDCQDFGARILHAPSLREWPLATALEVNTVVVSAVQRRADFNARGGFNSGIGYYSDWDLWLNHAKAGARFQHLPGLHFFRRIHPAQWTTAVSPGDARRDAIAHLRLFHQDLAPTDRIMAWAPSA